MQGQQCEIIACTPVSKTCLLSDTRHTQPRFTMKAPKSGLENQSCDQEQSHRFPAGCLSTGWGELEAKGMQLSSTHQDICWRADLGWTITECQS